MDHAKEPAQIIAAVQDKGGVGKSLFVCALAAWMAGDGARVVIVDTDPQQDCMGWIDASAARDADPGVDVVCCLDDQKLPDLVAHLAVQADVVLIDTAGYKSAMSLYAVQLSDLVLVPLGPSLQDTKGALRVWKHVEAASKTVRRTVGVSLILNQADPRANITATIKEALAGQGAPLLPALVPARTGFREFMTHGGPLPPGARPAFGAVMASLQQAGLLSFYR